MLNQLCIKRIEEEYIHVCSNCNKFVKKAWHSKSLDKTLCPACFKKKYLKDWVRL